MDLLLQAAKVLELEQSDVGSDRVSPRSTRGSFFQPFSSRSLGENGENSDGSLSYSENSQAGGEDDAPLAERRRAGGAGTREVHNQLEKNRRKQLRECFSQLQQVVPSLENKRVATQSILQGAIKHIKNLKKKDVEQEREIQMLAKRKSELKKKYDFEFNRCTEEQHRAADVIFQVLMSKQGHEQGQGSRVIPPPAVPVRVVEEEDGNTSDSTTTASEGPCNEEDFSDDDTHAVQPRNLPNSMRLERKRKLEERRSSGEALDYSMKTHRDSQGGATTLQRSSGSFGSKSFHPSSSVSSSTSSVSSSSFALKQMLEQRKKNQVLVAPTAVAKHVPREGLTSSKAEHPTSHLRPVAPAPLVSNMRVSTPTPPGQPKASPLASKNSAKSASSLTSSYPMISNHLASSVRKPASLPPAGIITQDKLQPAASPLVDIWTSAGLTNKLAAGVKAPDMLAEASAASKATAANLASSLLTRGQGLENSKLLQASVPQFSSPTILPPIFSSTTVALPTSLPPASTPALSVSNNSRLPLQQVVPAGLRTPEAQKMDNPFVLSPKALSVLQGPELQGAALLGKNIIGSNTSVGSLQPMATNSPLSSANWASSKVVPAIIPLTSFLRGLPLQGGVSPLAAFAPGPTLPISVASVRTSSTPATWAAVSPTSTPIKTGVSTSPDKDENDSLPPFSNASSLAAAASKQDLHTPVASLATSNTRIATLLSGGNGGSGHGGIAAASNPPNSLVHLNSNNNTNISMPTSTGLSTSSPPSAAAAAATVTLSLPDGLKPVTLTPTLLPLTFAANLPLAGGSLTNQTGGTAAGQHLRLFAPLSQHASLPNGQSVNGLVPTVVQLGSTGQLALLQPSPAHLQASPAPQLLAPPIVVMTTQTTGTEALSTQSTGLVTASGAGLSTAASSSSSVL